MNTLASGALSQQYFEQKPLPMEAIILAQQLVLLPLYFFVPIWIPLLNSIAAMLVLYAHYHPTFTINRWLKLAITGLAIASVFILFRKFSGRDAGVALISAMYGLKILEVNSRRDANLLLCLGFFMIVAGFLFSQKPLIALYQFVPVIAILNAFIGLNSLQKFQLGGGSLSAVLKNLGRYLLIAIPIMLVLFVFFPRLSGPLWRMPGSNTATTGISDSMSLGEIGALQLSEEVAFRVNFTGPEPLETDLYWRVLTLDHFDGLNWTRLGARPIADLEALAANPAATRYSITLEATQLNYLVTLDRPLTSPDNGSLMEDYTSYSKYRILDRMRYSIISDVGLAIDRDANFGPNSRYLTLPANSNSRTRAWAETLRESHQSDWQFVDTVLRQINREEYHYTLTPGIMDDPVIDSFWFDKRRGFCEHYASALAFIARAAGIPSRVVVGYQGAEKNPLSDYWIVRQSRAHAWTELWLQNQGWVRIDPTTSIARHRIEPNLLAEYGQRLSLFDDFEVVDLDDLGLLKQVQYWMDQINSNWNDWILDYNSDRQRQLFSFWGLEKVTHRQLYIGMIVIVAFILVVSSLRWLQQREVRDPLAVAFNAMLEKLIKQNIVGRNVTLGPLALSQLLAAKDPQKFDSHIQLIQQYVELRYAAKNDEPKAVKRLVKSIRRLS